MVEFPDSLQLLYTGQLEEQNGSYLIEVPASAVDQGTLDVGDPYRIAVLRSNTAVEPNPHEEPSQSQDAPTAAPSAPPVDEGEIREVTVESVGDQGDGIAKVERGYVVIVPDALPGDEPTVQIDQVQENVAFASIVEDDRTLVS
ncbi:TRAM domain-containing protein [Halorubrum sp. SP9]|uniref:TRAM domain-containing protein n=1 Tax=Halorubrum sp. SP9 TaxID=1537267 RepID=UPI0010F55910|nr:TRAM domain-containing protein [Halorubrum sp. SP9]TKX68639.1 TRAM domain-containing protein [Halorubrum sp. SP9]